MTLINESDRKCCNQCRGGWSEIGNQFGCLKVDCSCHSVPAEKCSCLEDNKLSQAFCKVHGKNNSDRVDMTWKERFDEKFPHILSTGTGLASEELKSFIASERELLLRELIDEIEKRRKYMLDIATASMTTRDVHHTNTSNMGYNSALVEVQELIRKKM